ncbi:MAG: hypothetical protein WCF67_19415 [Chitinophagaceae bacterium]
MILGGLIILLMLAVIGVNIYLKTAINNRLSNTVNKASHGLYTLEYSGIRVNILTGTLIIRDVKLIPDTTLLSRLRQQHTAPKLVVGANTSRLAFRNVHWLAFLNSHQLHIGKLVMEQPHFSVIHLRHDSSIASAGISDVSNQLKDLRIGTLSLEDAIVQYHAIDTGQRSTHNAVEHLDLDLSKIHFANIGTRNAELTAEDYRIRVKEYKRITDDSLYVIGIKGLDFSSKKKNGRLDSFYTEPRYDEKEFARKFDHQETRYQVQLKDITFDGVELTSLSDNVQLIVKKLDIGSGAANMFMDRSLPPRKADDGEIVISKKVAKLFVPFALEQITFNNFGISYREYNPASGKTAHLSLEDVTIKGSNLTNLPAFINRNKQFKAGITGRFLNAEVKADFDFDLTNSQGSFTGRIKANQIAADRLNPILSAIAKIEARKGILKQLEASVSGNENEATANVNLLYEGLKVNILQKEGDTLKKKGIKTMFANLFVMDDNPKDGVLRTATSVRRQRAPGKSFFNMFWSAIAAGIQDIVTDKKGFGTGPG